MKYHKHKLASLVVAVLFILPLAISCKTNEKKTQTQEGVRVYSAPKGIELSKAFKVTVEGRETPVYKAKVPAVEQIPRLKHNPNKYGIASYTSFDIRKGASVTVTYPDPIKSIKILPTSYGIEPEIEGQTIKFKIDKPKHVTVEVNGNWQESLHIFANPFEEHIPKPSDPNVVYFGPGIHDVTSVEVKDNMTVYIAGEHI